MLTTPIIRAIRRARPAAHLTYLVESQAASVVTGNPHLDETIVTPLVHGMTRLREDLTLAVRLRRGRYDAVLDLHGGPRSSLLAFATGAPVRLGYTIAGRGWMYTRQIERPRGHRPRHSVENQWDLAEALLPELGRPAPGTDPVEMREDPEAARRADRRLLALGFLGSELIVIHVGAGNEFRRWPEAAFAEVVVALTSAQPNRRIILTSGAGQEARAAEVRRLAIELGAPPAAVAVVCDMDLAALRSVLARAALFVGGDSGPAHIAATTATPMVVIYGPTLPVVWGPWRDPALVTETVDAGELPCRPCEQRVCGPGDFRCLRGIRPEAVTAAAFRALERARDAGAGNV